MKKIYKNKVFRTALALVVLVHCPVAVQVVLLKIHEQSTGPIESTYLTSLIIIGLPCLVIFAVDILVFN